MLRLQPTPRKIGVKISGDFQDIHSLIHSIENLYYKINQIASQNRIISADLLGDLLFNLRAAIQGTRQIESVNNGANEMGQLFVDLETVQAEVVFRERRRHEYGNLYYSVTINSIEVIGYLRFFHDIIVKHSSLTIEHEDLYDYSTEKAVLYQFYCFLRQAVCIILGENRMHELLNQYQNEVRKLVFIPYEYEFLNYLKNSFLYRCAGWSTLEIESAIFSLALLQCQTPKNNVLSCTKTDPVREFLEDTPECEEFPVLYDDLAAGSKDGQVYMDEVFPDIDKYLASWENVCR